MCMCVCVRERERDREREIERDGEFRCVRNWGRGEGAVA